MVVFRPFHALRGLLRPLAATLLVMTSGALVGAELTILEEDSPAHLTGLGNEALVDGRYEIAASLYRRALEQDHDYVTARFNLGLAYQRLGDFIEARKAYDAVLSAHGDHAPALANLAWLEWKQGDNESAATHYAEAARYASDRPRSQAEYLYGLGAIRDAQGRPQEARKAYEQAIAADGTMIAARFNLGTLMLGPLAGTPSALATAREHLEYAVAIDPTRVDAWLNLALCRERQSDAAGAEEALDKAVSVASGDDAARSHWRRALWYDRQVPPRRIAMRDDLEACLKLVADFPDANGRLGAYLYAIGDYDRAIKHLEREVSDANDMRTPADREAHFLLAEIYTDHRPDAAKALLHAAAAQDSTLDPRLRELHHRVDVLLEPKTRAGANTAADSVASPAPASKGRDDGAH
jgi:tetratricopeptide (TPR) repeat protein